jgi:hypothetical protein
VSTAKVDTCMYWHCIKTLKNIKKNEKKKRKKEKRKKKEEGGGRRPLGRFGMAEPSPWQEKKIKKIDGF